MHATEHGLDIERHWRSRRGPSCQSAPETHKVSLREWISSRFCAFRYFVSHPPPAVSDSQLPRTKGLLAKIAEGWPQPPPTLAVMRMSRAAAPVFSLAAGPGCQNFPRCNDVLKSQEMRPEKNRRMEQRNVTDGHKYLNFLPPPSTFLSNFTPTTLPGAGVKLQT